MNMKWLLSCVAIITAAAVIGCTSMTSQQQGTLSGAAIGAAAGAGIAAISGGNLYRHSSFLEGALSPTAHREAETAKAHRG